MVSRADRTAFAEWWWTVDRFLLVGFIALMVGGVVLSLAGSPAVAERIGYDSFHFVERHVFFLVGSLLRRIGITDKDRAEDAARERYMWARMRAYLREHKIDPRDAIHVCGAIHAVSPIEEFGTRTDKEWAITPRTPTKWFYGIVPSSYAAIEHQFSLPAGEIAIARWAIRHAQEQASQLADPDLLMPSEVIHLPPPASL